VEKQNEYEIIEEDIKIPKTTKEEQYEVDIGSSKTMKEKQYEYEVAKEEVDIKFPKITSEKQKVKLGTIEKEIEYQKVEETPSMFRSYGSNKAFYVRGLFFDEVRELSKFNNDYSIAEGVKVFRNAIKFEDPNMTIEDMEISDFVLATTISNLYTNPEHSWSPNFRCDNIIDNPKITKNEKMIKNKQIILENINMTLPNFKDENLKKAESDIEKLVKEIGELQKEIDKLKSNPDNLRVKCNTVINSKITLADLAFRVEDSNVEVPIYFNLEGVELELAPLTIRDYIFLEKNLERLQDELNTSDETIVKALYIKNEDMILQQKIDVIKYSMPSEVLKLDEQIVRFDIDLENIILTCPNCKKEYVIDIDIVDLKVYPRL